MATSGVLDMTNHNADDLIIIFAGHHDQQRALDKLFTYCTEWNLTINTDKTMVMHVPCRSVRLETPPPVVYDGVILEWGEGFNYLGVFINTKGIFQPKNAPIVLKAHKAQFKLTTMVCMLTFDTKMWLHQAMVDPILLQGAEELSK